MVFSVPPNSPVSDRWSEMMKYIASKPVPFVSAAEPAKDALSQGKAADAASLARQASVVDGTASADPAAKPERAAPLPTGDTSLVSSGPPASTVTKGMGQVRRESVAITLALAGSVAESPPAKAYPKPDTAANAPRGVDIKA
ncbi:hypothetical protein [Palleronia pelagia]|uniref:Uncharacterized protein n=1 Tax=Palleronia pelagia TaxID=387096 RepID=A0A1H8BYQ4_9RHOB|nr:hypothetical protein [Palleronia pelagia]SEM86987.1 hypothetical protein SAMN04488011_101750 [Palleronia pelagia]